MAYDLTLTPTKLGRGTVATTPTLTTFYTVPSGFRTFVKNIDLANTTAGALTITLYLVESGGTAGASNTLIPTVTINANSMLQWSGSQVLNAGDSIQATASGAGITANISGGEAA